MSSIDFLTLRKNVTAIIGAALDKVRAWLASSKISHCVLVQVKGQKFLLVDPKLYNALDLTVDVKFLRVSGILGLG